MSTIDPYAALQPPPAGGGQYPDRIKFESPGQSVEGVLVNVRWKEPSNGLEGCPVVEIQQANGTTVSVFCNPISLWRQLDATKPALGSMVRITFAGFEGQAKVFRLDVAPAGTAPAPQAPAAAPAQPEGWSQPGAPAAPWGQAPAAPAAPANGAPAPPWGS